MTFLEAIAREEGFYTEGSRPQRNHNPGDLVFCTESIHFGATGGDGRFAIFPSEAVGWDALRRWLSVPAKFDPSGDLVGGYLGATVRQVINRFAPPYENETQAYVRNVCAWAEVQPDDVVTAEMLSKV